MDINIEDENINVDIENEEININLTGGGGGVAASNTFGMSNLGNTLGTSGVLASSNAQLLFAGGNNITLSQSISLNSATITISAPDAIPQSVQTQNMVSVQNSTGNILFSNTNGMTFGFNNSIITASHDGLTSQSNQALSGSNGSFAFQTASFGNLNGMSFYTTNGSLVASYTVPSQSIQTQNMVSVEGSTGNIEFDNANGISFGFDASTITASHNGLTSQSAQALSGSNGSFAFQTATFGNLNGLSFYSSNGSMVASYTTPPAQTIQTQNMVSIEGSTGNIEFDNANGITFGFNASTVTASHNGLTSQSNQAISGSNGSFAFQTVTFGNANGMSFYTSNGSMIASYTVPTQSVQTQNMVSIEGSTGDIQFDNANGITFGFDASTVTASHNGLTSQSNQALSGSNGSFTFQTATFGNLNGMSFYTSNNSLVGSYTVPTQSVQTQNLVSIEGSTGNIEFDNANGITFGFNASTVTASHNGLTSQSNQALSGSNGSFTFQTATLGSSNGMHFYTTNGSIVGSYTVPTQTNQTIGMYATGNTTQSSTGTQDARSLTFRGYGIVSVGVSNGSVVISATDGGGGGLASAGMSNIGNTSGTTGLVSNQIVFAGGNNITLSQSVDGGNATVTISAPSGGVDRTVSSTKFGDDLMYGASTGMPMFPGMFLYPAIPEFNVSASLLKLPIAISASTSAVSSGAVSMDFTVGAYSRNATNDTILTLHGSTSYSIYMSFSSNVSMALSFISDVVNSTSYGTSSTSSGGSGISTALHGNREMAMPFNTSFAAGVEYFMAFQKTIRASGTTSPMNVLMVGGTSSNPFRLGFVTNSTGFGLHKDIGFGIWSSTGLTSWPVSFNMSDIRVSGANSLVPFHFINQSF